MTGCIYMLVSPTGKQYIGRTSNFKNRMRAYRTKGNYDRSPVYREIGKYGFENFQKYVLEEIEANTYEELSELLNEAEERYIAQYDTVENGLNRNRKDSNLHVIHLSEETKERMSKVRTGKKFSEESKAKKSGANAYQGKKVMSDKLGMTFPTLRDAARYVGISNGCKISEVISGLRKSCGTHPVTGERIDDWKYA